MFSFLKQKSSFLSSVLTLGIGTSIAQVISIAVSPILTRLYSPEDFGVYAFYMSMVSVLAVIATGRYELAIALPKRREEGFQLATLVISLSVVFSSVLFIALYLFKRQLAYFLGDVTLESYIFILMPLSVLCIGISLGLMNLGYREHQYAFITFIRIAQNSLTALVSCLLGWLSSGILGLLLGLLFGQILSAVSFLKRMWFGKDTVDFRSMFEGAKAYKNFLLYSTPMGVLNTLSFNLLQYGLLLFFNSTLLGYYYFAQRLLSLPLDIIMSSFSPVFYQELGTTVDKLKLLIKSFTIHVFIGIVWVVPFMYVGEDIFGYIFGSQWRQAGEMALFIAPFIVMNFAGGSISVVFPYFQKNDILLYWQIVYTLGFGMVLFLWRDSFHDMLISSSIYGSFMYFVLFMLACYVVFKETNMTTKSCSIK